MVVRTVNDVEQHLAAIREAAANTQAWIAAQTGDPIDLLRPMKFATVGFHPVDGCPLNVVEQINQSWTYTVALIATRQLMELHPEAVGFRLAPGATASQPLDIMSLAEGLVGAERVFGSAEAQENGALHTNARPASSFVS